MNIKKAFTNGRLTVRLCGELDHHGVRDAMRCIDGLIDEYIPSCFVIDLSELDFMDSSGIALILRVFKKMNEICGRAWVENPIGQPRRVLDASGVDRVVKIYDSVPNS